MPESRAIHKPVICWLCILTCCRLTNVNVQPNTSSKESDLKLLDDTEFAALARAMQAEAVSSSEQYLQLDKRRRFGRDVWKSLLAAVLALILIEILLQQRFGMVKK